MLLIIAAMTGSGNGCRSRAIGKSGGALVVSSCRSVVANSMTAISKLFSLSCVHRKHTHTHQSLVQRNITQALRASAGLGWLAHLECVDKPCDANSTLGLQVLPHAQLSPWILVGML